MKKLLKVSGIVVLALAVLAVVTWHTLPLLPMTPQGEMTRAILVEMTRNEEQLAAQAEKSDAAYHHLQVMRQSFLPIAIQLTGPDPGVCEIAPLLPDIVRLSRACSRTDDLYSHYTKSENEWIATAPEVEPEVQAALVRDTEAFFRQAAEAADMRNTIRSLRLTGAALDTGSPPERGTGNTDDPDRHGHGARCPTAYHSLS